MQKNSAMNHLPLDSLCNHIRERHTRSHTDSLTKTSLSATMHVRVMQIDGSGLSGALSHAKWLWNLFLHYLPPEFKTRMSLHSSRISSVKLLRDTFSHHAISNVTYQFTSLMCQYYALVTNKTKTLLFLSTHLSHLIFTSLWNKINVCKIFFFIW